MYEHLSFSSIISMYFKCFFSLLFLFKDRVLIYFFLSLIESLIQAAIKYASNCDVIFSFSSHHSICEVNCTLNSVMLRIALGHEEAMRHLLQRFIMTTCKISGRFFLNMSQKPLLDCFWSLLSLESVSLSATL